MMTKVVNIPSRHEQYTTYTKCLYPDDHWRPTWTEVTDAYLEGFKDALDFVEVQYKDGNDYSYNYDREMG